MPNLQTLLTEMGAAILPNGIEFLMVLISLVGMWTIASAMMGAYKLALDGRQGGRGEVSLGGLGLRMLIGAAMTLPSVLFWRAGDAFLNGGGSTYSTVLAYVGGVPETGYCDKFTAVITLAFFLVGLVAVFVGFQNWDDQARGLNPRGLRQAVWWFAGGVGCIFITDIVDITANTLKVDTGFAQVCEQLGSP